MQDNLLEAIRGRKVLVWGVYPKSDGIVSEFKENGIDIAGYIDGNADSINEYNGCKVYKTDILNKDEYFVYVGAMRTYAEILDPLNEYGYKEFEDFWYPERIIKIDGKNDYSNPYGDVFINEGSAGNFMVIFSGGG